MRTKNTIADYLFTKPAWLISSALLFYYLLLQDPTDVISDLILKGIFAAIIPLIISYVLIAVGGFFYDFILAGNKDRSVFLGLSFIVIPGLVATLLDGQTIFIIASIYYFFLAGLFLKLETGLSGIVFTLSSIIITLYFTGNINL